MAACAVLLAVLLAGANVRQPKARAEWGALPTMDGVLTRNDGAGVAD